MLNYGVRSWCISQEDQVGYDSGDGIMNYSLQARSYDFDQVIFIVWIKSFVLFEKYFSFLSVLDMVRLNT